MISALGIGCDGTKTVLGIREGATENAAMVSSLLTELVERGLDFSTPRLYILDGGKALAAAVRKHAGEAGFIQRCQVHKRRNVVDHRTGATSPYAVLHQRDRGGLFHRRDRVPQRQTLAQWRSHRALGRFGIAG